MSRPIYVDLTFPKNVDFKFAYYNFFQSIFVATMIIIFTFANDK